MAQNGGEEKSHLVLRTPHLSQWDGPEVRQVICAGKSPSRGAQDRSVKARRIIPLLRRLGDAAFITMWLGSAIGHAWLLATEWGEISGGAAVSLLVAIVSSLFFAWISRGILARPERILIVTLLVCFAHMPTDTAVEPWSLVPAVVAVLGIVGSLGLGESRVGVSVPHFSGVTLSLPSSEPQSRALGFDLLCRPPPRCL